MSQFQKEVSKEVTEIRAIFAKLKELVDSKVSSYSKSGIEFIKNLARLKRIYSSLPEEVKEKELTKDEKKYLDNILKLSESMREEVTTAVAGAINEGNDYNKIVEFIRQLPSAIFAKMVTEKPTKEQEKQQEQKIVVAGTKEWFESLDERWKKFLEENDEKIGKLSIIPTSSVIPTSTAALIQTKVTFHVEKHKKEVEELAGEILEKVNPEERGDKEELVKKLLLEDLREISSFLA